MLTKTVILFIMLVVTGCSSTISKNQAVIDKGVLAREQSNGVRMKSYSIMDSDETADQLTLHIKVIQENGSAIVDTIRFSKSSVGILNVRE